MIEHFLNDMSTLTIATFIFATALLMTYLITSRIGLFILGLLSLFGLIVVGALHPYLFPLTVPLFAIWVMCASARRKNAKNAAPPSSAA